MRIFGSLLCVMVISFGFPGNARAAVPKAGIEAFGTEVSDSELAQMRGKFIRPDNVSFFGIEMLTSWQGQDGITTHARLVISLDFAGGASTPGDIVPQMLVSWSRDGDSSLDLAGTGGGPLASDAVIPVGGLDTVHGFVQHQQIAGDDNRVRNDMNVAIVPAGSGKLNTDGMTPLTSPTTTFADGDTLQFQLGGNQVGFLLTDGGDAVRQSVNGSMNQLAQHVLIHSSFNDITNRMNAIVGFDPSIQATQMNAQSAVNSMNGFGF